MAGVMVGDGNDDTVLVDADPRATGGDVTRCEDAGAVAGGSEGPTLCGPVQDDLKTFVNFIDADEKRL